MKKTIVQRLTLDGALLAILCIGGMFSIPLGENIKVSLQFFILLIIFGLCDHLEDKIIIPLCYVLIGLGLPIYAGFQSGLNATWGFVMVFPVVGIPFHFIMKIKSWRYSLKFVLASVVALLFVYLAGTLWLEFYVKISFGKALLIGTLPYIGFDAVKIVLSLYIVRILRKHLFKDPELLK